MPKTAAAVLGLALMTGSIGLNTVRYPVVWDMVGRVDSSTPAGESPPPATVPQSAASERAMPIAPEKPVPMPPVATETEAKPLPEPTDKIVPFPASSDGISPSQPDAAREGDSPAVDEESRKPLVPVLPASVPRLIVGNADPAAGLRRLPPVDPSRPGLEDRGASWLSVGSSPIYPSTNVP